MESVFLIINTDNGIIGYGSAHHYPIKPDEFRYETLNYLKKVKQSLIGLDPFDIEGIHELLDKVVPIGKNAARSALDFACHDIMGKAKGKPVFKLLGSDEPNKAPTVIGVYSKDSPKEITQRIMDKYMPLGLKVILFKLGNNLEVDLKRIQTVASIFPGKLMIHGAEAFNNPNDAIKFLNELYARYEERILLVAQPCPREDILAMKKISENSKIPVFAHYYKTQDDINKIIKMKAADGIWIHSYRMGGFYLCKKIISIVKENNLGIMIGNGGASGITITAATHLAAGTKGVLLTNCADDLRYPWIRIIKDEKMPLFKDGSRIPSNQSGLGIELKDTIKLILEDKMNISKEF
jgi:L-alanine-DL-glutamate epimerase-like enolase superfamily enzyme